MSFARSMACITCAAVLGLLLMHPHWMMLMVFIMVCALAVMVFAATSESRKRTAPVRLTEAQQRLSDALGSESPGQQWVGQLTDEACDTVVFVMSDPREGKESRVLFESVAQGHRTDNMEWVIELLGMRRRRMERAAVATRPTIDASDIVADLDITLAEANNREAIESERLTFRDFATWSRKIAVREGKAIADDEQQATKAEFLDVYIRALTKIRTGQAL